MDKTVVVNKGGCGLMLLFIVLVVLKCMGLMTVTWPLWVVGGIMLILPAIVLVLLSLAAVCGIVWLVIMGIVKLFGK